MLKDDYYCWNLIQFSFIIIICTPDFTLPNIVMPVDRSVYIFRAFSLNSL